MARQLLNQVPIRMVVSENDMWNDQLSRSTPYAPVEHLYYGQLRRK